MKPLRLLLICLALAPPQMALGAPDRLTGPQVRTLVQNALTEQGLMGDMTISDHRTYPGCDTSPTVRPRNAGWTSVELTCARPTPWKRVISTGISGLTPLTNRTDQPLEKTVLVLTESLAGGTVLEAGHLGSKPVHRIPSDALTGAAEDYVGRRLTANLAAGRPLLGRHLEFDWLVGLNTPVAIVLELSGINVLSTGIAMENGQRGDLINVQNSSSGRIIRATVDGANKVIVRPKMN
ncbi:flagellar basal body P-ring formation chaperone FlgA [Pseudoprimorskyibacter insulae]|uniref:Flagella basal body P-ring formation protein FlgA n=1 Tax=Pseudoprimorskyibacter insulae TaxID=1695997 RepID=A0A2R8AVN4_9RHOB|nr:flagellar basal body P-ring formation chaperone FlgA [Pseudoprimorskyibacter insulae]SPF80060.1 hypothetical protein PRI8871_01862 [Pseudoprimorskyibacter insulae]